MCLFQYSVSEKITVKIAVTLSAALAVQSMALRRNTEGIHGGDAGEGALC